MEFSEPEHLESGYIVRESLNNNKAESSGGDSWQPSFPEVTPVEDSSESNNSSGLRIDQIVHREKSKSNNSQLKTDLVDNLIDHDPVVTSTTARTTSLSSEALYQAKDQNEKNESDGFVVRLEENQSKLEDDKNAAQGISVMASPSIQMMERDGDYDPNRIPSSVFSRNDSANPGEWSAASNDSLFSLHGGMSFGRDQAVFLSAESRKVRDGQRPEELTMIDELTDTPPLASVGADDGKDEEKELAQDKTKEDVEKARPPSGQLAKPSSAITLSSVSGRSDGSEGSTFSFAFPILAPGYSSKKGNASSPQTSHYREPNSEAEHHSTAPPPQKPSASKARKFSCFSCCTRLSCCSVASFCSFRSCSFCSSCWPFKSRSR